MNDRARRVAEFREAPLVWLVVRHFLPAGLLKELAEAIVGHVGAGAFAIGDIAESATTGGPLALEGWAVTPRPIEGALARNLQYTLNFLVWRGDQSPGRGSDLTPEEQRRFAELDTALALSHGDVADHRGVAAGAPVPAEFEPVIAAMDRLRAAIDGDGGAEDATLRPVGVGLDGAAIEELIAALPSPLTMLLLKHLGDLAADRDAWDVSLALYLRASARLAASEQGIWRPLHEVFATPVEQSLAMARWVIDGPGTASTMLDSLVERGSVTGDPLPLLNAAHDAMNARSATGEWRGVLDRRVGLVLAPQAAATHHTGQAFGNLVEGRFYDAHRWFWATLRRQVALGITTDSRNTKAQFGRALFDDLTASLGRHNVAGDFLLAARLLVDSGHDRAIRALAWDERLLTRYLDVDCLAALGAFASRHRGVRNDRARALVALQAAWLGKLAPSAADVAAAMLRDLAGFAASHPHDMLTNLNVGGAAMQALRDVGKARPEFRELAIADVENAVNTCLDGSVRALEAALETAMVYVDEFSTVALRDIVGRLVSLLEDDPAGRGGIALRPALNLLSADAVLALLPDADRAFARRVAGTLLKLSLETETEHMRVMYLVRDLDPALIEDHVDAARLAGIVAHLAEQASKTNSSWSSGYVQALLVAPAVSGRGNVAHAVAVLRQVLEEAANAKHAPVALIDAYNPLLVLAREHGSISAALEMEHDEFVGWLRPLEVPLVAMWERAADEPLIFTGFALPPPSEPDRVAVHNWTFASLAIAQVIGATGPVERALDRAARNESLARPIGVARAVRAGIDSEAFSEGGLELEGAEAFYAALGRRLVAMRSLPEDERRGQLLRLLDRCLSLGPSGLDAGVFVAAVDCGLRVERGRRIDGYAARTRRSPELRHGLLPLIDAIASA